MSDLDRWEDDGGFAPAYSPSLADYMEDQDILMLREDGTPFSDDELLDIMEDLLDA